MSSCCRLLCVGRITKKNRFTKHIIKRKNYQPGSLFSVVCLVADVNWDLEINFFLDFFGFRE